MKEMIENPDLWNMKIPTTKYIFIIYLDSIKAVYKYMNTS